MSKTKIVSEIVEAGDKKSCIKCRRFDDCPIIKLWAGLNNPMVVHDFFCSEHKVMEDTNGNT